MSKENILKLLKSTNPDDIILAIVIANKILLVEEFKSIFKEHTLNKTHNFQHYFYYEGQLYILYQDMIWAAYKSESPYAWETEIEL